MVPIMQNTTVITSPLSHSQTCDTSRPRRRHRTARRAGLGTVSLVRLDEPRSRRQRQLILEHQAKRRPASVKDGFRHPCLGQSRAIHVANNDQLILSGDAGRNLMQEVTPLGGNFPVYLPGKRLPTGTLRSSQFQRRFPKVLGIADLLTSRKSGEILQAEINSNISIPARAVSLNSALEIEKPSSRGIFVETAAQHIFWDRPMQPQTKGITAEANGVCVDTYRPRSLERHPSERTSSASTDAPSRLAVIPISAEAELSGDGLKDIAADTEAFFAGPRQTGTQSYIRWPALSMFPGVLLRTSAPVPHLIDRKRHFLQTLSRALVLDPVAKSKDTGFSQRSARSRSAVRVEAAVQTPFDPHNSRSVPIMQGRQFLRPLKGAVSMPSIR